MVCLIKYLGREFGAALVAAALEDIASGFIGHALQKAVLSGT